MKISRLWAMLLVVSIGLIGAGCGQSESSSSDTSSSDDPTPYAVGDPLADSTYALVLSSPYGTDTLEASNYQQQLNFVMQRMPPNQRMSQMDRIHQAVVNQFVAQHVMRGASEERNLQPDSARISQAIQQQIMRMGGEEAFEKALQSNNLTRDSLRGIMANQMRQRMLRDELMKTASAPTQEEIQQYSKENRRIGAQHILIKVGENAPQTKVDSARQAAMALLDSLEAGASFTGLARRHSEGPSATRGGDLGMFSRDRMVEPFAEAAFALQDSGDVTQEPVRTRFGFHLIRLTDAGTPMDTTRARQALVQEKRQEAFRSELDELMRQVTVRANPEIVQTDLSIDQPMKEQQGSSS